MPGIEFHAHRARSRLIDFYGNGSEYLLSVLNHTLLLVDYANGSPRVHRYLWPIEIYGFEVGDANHDGLPDIVAPSGSGFAVWENMGGGEFVERRVESSPSALVPYPLDEIRMGDLDGDGWNEIVMVGNGRYYHDEARWTHSFCIFGYSDGVYSPVFSFGLGSTIEGVGIGDLDGDGIDEVVTQADTIAIKGTGVSVWDYDDGSGSFVQSFEIPDNYEQTAMLNIVIGPLDGDEKEKALVSEYLLRDNLTIIEWVDGEYVAKALRPSPKDIMISGIDVYSLMAARETTLAILVLLVVCGVLWGSRLS